MAVEKYKRRNKKSPIQSYNLIRSKQRSKPDKVIVTFGPSSEDLGDRKKKLTSYTYTSVTLGRANFEALVAALETGRGAARHILYNVDPGNMGWPTEPSRAKDRHVRKVVRRQR